MKQKREAGVVFVLVSLLLSTIGIGVVIPVLPRLVASFVGGDVAAGSSYFGAFVSVYAAMQFICAPIIGGLSDRFGRRPVILISTLGTALDYLLLTFAPSLGWLFVGRVISGITGASLSAASSYIADVTPEEKRAQSFGLIGAMFGIGFILGPALGGLLGGAHPRLPFAVASGLNALNFLYGLFVLPESLAPQNRRPFTFKRANPLASLKNLGRHPIILGLTGTLVCSLLAQQSMQSTWALYTQARFDFSTVDVGASLAVVGVANVIVQGGLIRAIMPRLGERRALLVGLFIGACGFVVIGLATRGWMLYAILVPFALSGLAGPATQALISREVGPTEQGEVQGSLTSLQSITSIVGPLVATGLFARFGAADAKPFIPGAPFFAAALMNILGMLLAIRLFSKQSSS